MHVFLLSRKRLLTSATNMAGSFSCFFLSLSLLCSSLHCSLAIISDERDNDMADQLIYPSTFEQTGRTTSRLSHLLGMKDSLSRLKANQPRMKDDDDLFTNNQDMPGVVQKRVFCNSYAGCGTDHKRRRVIQVRRIPRRQKKSVVDKRPFCNTYGCYNGRKRSFEPQIPEIPFENMVRDGKLHRSRGFGHFRRSDSMKSLRSSTLPILIGKSSGDPFHLSPSQALSLIDRLSESEPHQNKRFFAGGFDNAMENFVNDLKR